MELRIENGKIGITAAGLSDSLSREQVTNITGTMFDMIKMIHSYENTECEKIAIPEQIVTVKEEVSKAVRDIQNDRPAFRKRLPNNIVDVKDLTIEQAVTEKALVRCPHCGQSHVLAVHSNNHVYMMRKFYSVGGNDEFRIIAEFDSLTQTELVNMCCTPSTDRKAYFEDIQSIKMIDDKDFAVDNETEIFCPVCCTSDNFEAWKDAYQSPLKYFEHDKICDACGGEKLERLRKLGEETPSHKTMYQCDSCGLETEYEV